MRPADLPDCRGVITDAPALRRAVALAVSQCELAARLRGGLAPAGHFDPVIALFDQASATVAAQAGAGGTLLDFGADNDASRSYRIEAGPALPDADWSITFWVRTAQQVSAGDEQAMLAIANDGEDVFGASTAEVFLFPTAVATLIQGAAGTLVDLSYDEAGAEPQAVAADTDYLVVLQRRAGDFQIGAVPRGADAPVLRTVAVPAWTAVAAKTWTLGRRNFFGPTPYRNPIGELAVLTGDSLSLADLTTMASGQPITAVRSLAQLEAYLPFRTAEAVETDLTGNGYNAARAGTGFTLADWPF